MISILHFHFPSWIHTWAFKVAAVSVPTLIVSWTTYYKEKQKEKFNLNHFKVFNNAMEQEQMFV